MTTAQAEKIIPTGVWKSDPVHSSVGFSVKHMVVATFRGDFDDFDITLSNEGGAVAKRAQNASALARMIADEGVEFGSQQRAVALRVDGHAFLAPLRCP